MPAVNNRSSSLIAQGWSSARLQRLDYLALCLAALLFVYGAAVRLIALYERPFTADESAFATVAYRIAINGEYRYHPWFHGPLFHYLNATFFSLFGATDKIVRLPVVLIGIALLSLALPLARIRGSRVGLAFLALTALSPTYAFLSREVRGDTLVLLLVSGCLLLALHSSPRAVATFVLLAAAAAATKVTAIITLGIAGVAVLIVAPKAVFRRLRALSKQDLIVAGIAIIVGVFLLIFLHTGFGAHLKDWNALWRAAFAWLYLQAHPHHPGGFLYFPGLLAVYEPFICVLALTALGCLMRDPWCRFLALFFAGSLAFYGWAQEKVPNLVLYPLLPATFLAAELLGSIRRRSLLWVTAAALLVTALVQARVVRRSGILDFERPSRLEALAHGTMSPQLPVFVERVLARSEGRVVAADRLFQLLLAWPLRGQTIQPLDQAPAVALRVAQSLGGEVVLCAWVPVWEEASMRQLLDYVLTQEAFGEFSCQFGAIGP